MSLQDTPSGERVHIGLFGRRNAGKSSLLNGITGQSVAIVSEEKGTTTDPVKKAMELLPVGPVLWIDTPGMDDDSTLGGKRVEKTRQWWQTVDMALLVLDGSSRDFSREKELLAELRQAHKPYGILVNKEDQMQDEDKDFFRQAFPEENIVFTCAKKPEAMEQLRDVLAKKCYETLSGEKRELLPDWISPKKPVVLVVPVDSAAPKGRLILPAGSPRQRCLLHCDKGNRVKRSAGNHGRKTPACDHGQSGFFLCEFHCVGGSTAHFFFNFDGPVQRRFKTPGGGSRCAGPFGRGSKDPYL